MVYISGGIRDVGFGFPLIFSLVVTAFPSEISLSVGTGLDARMMELNLM
jgi:hypothetical protein